MATNSEALVDAVKTEIEAASIPEIPDINGVEVKKETNENKANEKSIITQLRLKKQAVMLCYCGRGYFGMQRQGWDSEFQTIETDLVKAFYETGCINEDCYKDISKFYFQRAARTDKGVSACKQIVSCRLPYNFNEDYVSKVNALLPESIRVMGSVITTRYFDSKNFCDARTYSYMMPTFAICPIDQTVREDYRVTPEILKEFNEDLSLYKGSHNFHNFTSQRKPEDASCSRFIKSIEASEPFIKDDLEFVIVRVKGQSFMLHQIRKMIGLALGIMRGLTTTEVIKQSWLYPRIDIPRAPGIGLMLEEVHYDNYNRRFGGDGMHQKLLWDDYNEAVTEFKHQQIYPVIVETEKNEKSMFQWLQTLPLHTFNAHRQPGPNILVPLGKIDTETEVKDEDGLRPFNEYTKAAFKAGSNLISKRMLEEMSEEKEAKNAKKDEDEEGDIERGDIDSLEESVTADSAQKC